MAEPILTAAETHAAEQALFEAGIDPLDLMEQAGVAVAERIVASFEPRPVLVACGPGNNGGDGYVVARHLAGRGWPVTVAALAEPATGSAKAMRARWAGPVGTMPETPGDGLVVDALFGIGSRAVEPALARWLDGANSLVAVDQPSGLDTDGGAARGRRTPATLTVALGALKPVHALMPGAGLCGRIELAPIGLSLPPEPKLVRIGRPALRGPDQDSNKYSRGKVVVVAGAMLGAGFLAAEAAQRAGAGYVEVVGDDLPFGTPLSLVRRGWSEDAIADDRVGAFVIGPGFADGRESRERLAAVLAREKPVVLDAGALALLDLPLPSMPLGRQEPGVTQGSTRGSGLLPSQEHEAAPRLLTPHAGEFVRLFGPIGEDPLAAVRQAAVRAGAMVLLKGAASILAHPDGRAAIAPVASPWLATAGTGDVLAGICGTMLAQAAWHGLGSFAAVQAALWLHARAAERAGGGLIADDLLYALKTVIAKA